MRKIEIRQMCPQDLPRVIGILAHWSMAPVAPGAACPVPETTGLEPDHTLVAIVGGEIVGVASYVLLGAARAETASLALDPAWRGQGIGERLQRERLAALKALGIRHVRTEADRPETIAWYLRKFGYRIAGTAPKKHAFSLKDVPDWTVLELELGG